MFIVSRAARVEKLRRSDISSWSVEHGGGWRAPNPSFMPLLWSLLHLAAVVAITMALLPELERLTARDRGSILLELAGETPALPGMDELLRSDRF